MVDKYGNSFPSQKSVDYVSKLLSGEIKSPPRLVEHRNEIIQSCNEMIQSYLIEGDGDITLHHTGGFVK